MTHYRLYFFSQEDHIVGVEDFDAKDDASAIARAPLEGPPPMELWSAERKIERWQTANCPSAPE